MKNTQLPAAQVFKGISEEMRVKIETAESRTIMVECPICKKDHIRTIFTIALPVFLIKESSSDGGITTIHVEPSCGHHFDIYVDTNFKIRGFVINALSVQEIQEVLPKKSRRKSRSSSEQEVQSIEYATIKKLEPDVQVLSIKHEKRNVTVFLANQINHEGDIAERLAQLNEHCTITFKIKNKEEDITG